MKLSICLTTYNEEANIGACLEAVKGLADEIVIVDGTSSDKTVEIAQQFGARVFVRDNPPNFHINKQKAIDKATGDWILFLDADERVSSQLKTEIQHVLQLNQHDLEAYEESLPEKELFLRHQALINARDGSVGEQKGDFVAFYIPRMNYFLGKYLRYGGVYPDGVIRLFKRGMAYLPAKDVHEQMVVKGRVGWLQQPLYHYDSPTFKRYLMRNSRYINLMVKQYQEKKLHKNIPNFISLVIVKPITEFFLLQIRHKGLLDGWQGIVFSFFSALRFPRAYMRYLRGKRS